MSELTLVVLVPVILLFYLALTFTFCLRRQKKEEKELTRHREIGWQLPLCNEIENTFSIKLDRFIEVRESHVKEEIIRQVNLLAKQTAEACMNQDKANRGKIETYRLGRKAYELKIQWSKARDLALKIAPELADRLPHFSKFEPLKSYNAKHLLQKKARQPVVT